MGKGTGIRVTSWHIWHSLSLPYWHWEGGRMLSPPFIPITLCNLEVHLQHRTG